MSKKRLGFVSNSSSSSFCIYGSEIDLSKFIDEDDEDCSAFDKVESLVSDAGLEFICDYDGEYYAVGKSFTDIKDDETGKQFKDSIEEAVKKLFPDQELKFETCEGEISC
jgi:hypothetical protein